MHRSDHPYAGTLAEGDCNQQADNEPLERKHLKGEAHIEPEGSKGATLDPKVWNDKQRRDDFVGSSR